jgi:uncharacterized protein DUF6062
VVAFAAVSLPSAEGRRRPSSTLPVRDFAEIRVAEQLAAEGCPLCGSRATAERRFVDTIIGEAVNDVAVRRRLDAGGGFCSRHAALLPTRERASRGGTLGSAILLGSVVRARVAALEEIASSNGRGLRRRLSAARQPPACPVCIDTESSVGSMLTVMVGRLADSAWAAAIGEAALCLDDLLLLWDVTAQTGGRTLAAWRPIGAAQLGRLRESLDAADAYVDHSGHDRQAELTDAERVAADRLVELLAGDGPG